MKRFILAVFFCSSLLLAGLYLTTPSADAANNVLHDLLNLPSPPPPNPLLKDEEDTRPEDFYDPYKPPPDDAPIEDLTDYWSRQAGNNQRFSYNATPSVAVMQRLLKVCEEEPERLTDFVHSFPPNATIAEKVKSFYDDEVGHDRLGEDWQRQIKTWLTDHSTYYLDRLVKKARAVREDRDYVTNQDDLLNLAEVDWDSAEPIINKLLEGSNQPVSATLATWCLYRHALEKGDKDDIDKYREQLKAIVEDKTAGAGKRDLAFDALVKEGDWEGRDEWYLTLMADETLAELRVNDQNYTGLTTIMQYSPPTRYKEKMLELLKSDNVHVRTAAIRNLSELVEKKDVDVIKALLPWLSDKRWAREVDGERNTLVRSLRELPMPESVPGLIAMMNEKEDFIVPGGMPANRMTNAMNAAANAMRQAEEAVAAARASTNLNMNIGTAANTNAAYRNSVSYPYRESAVYALTSQKDSRAAPALRGVLPEVQEYMRGDVVRGIWNAGGFSLPEQLSAVEAAARTTEKGERERPSSEEGYYDPWQGKLNGPFHPGMVSLLLGNTLTIETNVSDELVMATINRIEVLQRSEPRVALALRKILTKWHGPAMNIFALRQVRKGTANIDIVIRVLSLRKELRETLPGEINELNVSGPFPRAIAACIMEDPDNYKNILFTGDAATKIAVLGCARMVRAPLPLEKVEEELKNPDKMLAAAAEHYLESEDSPAARRILFSHFPDKMKILGARTAFRVSNSEPAFDELEMDALFTSVGVPGLATPGYIPIVETLWEKEEKALKQEFTDDKDLAGLYYYNDNFIRLYGDRAVFRWSEDEARYRERPLKKEEFEAFTSFLTKENVDAMPPFLSLCEYCEETQMVMLGRAGGRRLFFRASEMSKVQQGLNDIFEEFRKVPGKLHYKMEKHLPGLEILFEDENLSARIVWKNNDDLRLLIENTVAREKADSEMRKSYMSMGEEMEEDPTPRVVEVPSMPGPAAVERVSKLRRDVFHWHKFTGGILGDVMTSPPGIDTALDEMDPLSPAATWKSRTAAAEYRGSFEGLYKISGGSAVKIKEGRYMAPIITPNGRWLIVTKFVEYKQEMVRINLLNNREFPINIPVEGTMREAKVFIPSLNRVLINNSSYSYELESEGGEGEETDDEGQVRGGIDIRRYLLDPETGGLIEVRNEVGPLEQQSFRALQPVAGKPDTFWAAIPSSAKKNTRFGTYNAKTLLFTPLQTIPEIQFDSMDAWVDEAEGKVYIVYKGQLLRIPLPTTPRPGAPAPR